MSSWRYWFVGHEWTDGGIAADVEYHDGNFPIIYYCDRSGCPAIGQKINGKIKRGG